MDPASLKKGVISKDILIDKRIYELQNTYEIWLENTRNSLKNMIKKLGPLPSKAFPGRASILINSLSLNHDDISIVYEKTGSLKVNHYVPGTRIPIKSDDELVKNIKNIDVLINWAWHISGEIESYLKKLGFKGIIIEVMPHYKEKVIK